VVHRDVKTGNLLLDRERNVHVADFGIASATGMDSLTMTGTVLGTAGYLSPEQAQGDRATSASDRYALGVLAFELLTGDRPFAPERPAATCRVSSIPSLSVRSQRIRRSGTRRAPSSSLRCGRHSRKPPGRRASC